MWNLFLGMVLLSEQSVAWDRWAAVAVAIAGLIYGLYQRQKRLQDKKDDVNVELQVKDQFEANKRAAEKESDENWYRRTLKDELGVVHLLRHQRLDIIKVELLDTFVSLNLTASSGSSEAGGVALAETQKYLSPEEVITRAFQAERLLLIIGDPGSGKTTLLKFYATHCLNNRYQAVREFGLQDPRLVIYFPLREVKEDVDDQGQRKIWPLHQQLNAWASQREREIDPDIFYDWLHKTRTLILLDGLDEISDLHKRIRVCSWIDQTVQGLHKAYFVVTSRETGYRKVDNVELGFPHLRADITDFTPEQQKQFLQSWLSAAYISTGHDAARHPDYDKWEGEQRRKGLADAEKITAFLAKEENHSTRDLAGTPMLLQIMATLWKERDILPETRRSLFEAALEYMLEFRDSARGLEPLLPARKSMLVLQPLALWMQASGDKADGSGDEMPCHEFHERMQVQLDNLSGAPTAIDLCHNLRDRAGILVEYGGNYLFRHKSFREYLVGRQLVKDCQKDATRCKSLAKRVGNDWWLEPLRFMMSEADENIFNLMMSAIFTGPATSEMSEKQQRTLRLMIGDASEKPVTALAEILETTDVTSYCERYLLGALKQIDSKSARDVVRQYLQGHPQSPIAREIVAEWDGENISPRVELGPLLPGTTEPNTFRSPLEYNAEYILIPGGSYTYSVSERTETVTDTYFAKYPLTFKRYKRFIRYVLGEEQELAGILDRERFAEQLQASAMEELRQHFMTSISKWPALLVSGEADNRRFNGDGQPVVGITWFAAKLYCFWLSTLETIGYGREDNTWYYDLPNELEWEWAAGGGDREYPWSKEIAEPFEKLANYARNVGATTEVGIYPKGATLQGLADMAGNVWEWQNNTYRQDGVNRSLRGASWSTSGDALRCTKRLSNSPNSRFETFGFRVIRRKAIR